MAQTTEAVPLGARSRRGYTRLQHGRVGVGVGGFMQQEVHFQTRPCTIR
jgi:hypothetical protein